MRRSSTRFKSTYAPASSGVDVPPCPRSYRTPMTNVLRNHDIKSIKAVRDEIQAVSDRTQWEVRKLTERLIEIEIEIEIEMQGELHDEVEDEDLSAWL